MVARGSRGAVTVDRMPERDLDVVVLGAGGATGRRVAGQLARRAAEGGVRWAAAGRDPAKLARVLEQDGVRAPELLAADATDPRSLAALAARARVLLTTVSPYTRFGPPVVEACVAHGCHYVDLTGEVPFVRRTIDGFHARAAAAGVKLVHFGGFVPSDVSVLLAAEAADARWGEALADVEVRLELRPPLLRPSDRAGYGTARAVLTAVADEGSQAMHDPAALVDDGARAAAVRRRSPISVLPRLAGATVVAPIFPFAYIGPAVVHRSAAIVAAERGDERPPFRFREGLALRGPRTTLPLRAAAAGAWSGVQGSLGGIALAPAPVKRALSGALDRLVPSSGYTPPLDRQRRWSWRMTTAARTDGGHRVRVEVGAQGHIGYIATGTLMAETGLLLAEPGATPARAGCLTPATALGSARVSAFERADVRFVVSA